MDRYVIRDTYNMEFLSCLDNNGVTSTNDLKKAIIFENLEKAKNILTFIDNEDCEIQEIEFKTIQIEEE